MTGRLDHTSSFKNENNNSKHSPFNTLKKNDNNNNINWNNHYYISIIIIIILNMIYDEIDFDIYML